MITTLIQIRPVYYVELDTKGILSVQLANWTTRALLQFTTARHKRTAFGHLGHNFHASAKMDTSETASGAAHGHSA